MGSATIEQFAAIRAQVHFSEGTLVISISVGPKSKNCIGTLAILAANLSISLYDKSQRSFCLQKTDNGHKYC